MMASPVFLPTGTRFTADDLTFFAGKGARTLDEALAEADLIVSCPHSGAAIPEELAEFLSPDLTKRLQYDFTDCSTAPIVRRWAEIDPRIVYVENPQPRLVRDPNRLKPPDLVATLTEAFGRVKAAGPGHRVDLTGCDAVRPVTFSFFPIFTEPADFEGLLTLAEALATVSARGVDVYEQTRDNLVARLCEQTGGGATFLSFHDTMNHTTHRDGAVSAPRAEADLLPPIVALSNRGNHDGEPRDGNPVTMRPESIRDLAKAHRIGFAAAEDSDVGLNQPYLGSNEIQHIAKRFPRGGRGPGRVPPRIPAGAADHQGADGAGHGLAGTRSRSGRHDRPCLQGKLGQLPLKPEHPAPLPRRFHGPVMVVGPGPGDRLGRFHTGQDGEAGQHRAGAPDPAATGDLDPLAGQRVPVQRPDKPNGFRAITR